MYPSYVHVLFYSSHAEQVFWCYDFLVIQPTGLQVVKILYS